MPKKSKEAWKTFKNVFDPHAERCIFKLITEGHFEELLSPISLGKEANIFTARTSQGELVIVKIYRLENCNFNKMYEYIKVDPRYVHLKQKRREIIFAWTQREYRNLFLARDAQVPAPLPITFKDNLLVESFIGDDCAAPMLKDLPPQNPQVFFDKIIDSLQRLWFTGLVHGDLSPFNILNFHELPVFIDFSQATSTKASSADALLERDIKNVLVYFKKHGIYEEPTLLKQKIKKEGTKK